LLRSGLARVLVATADVVVGDAAAARCTVEERSLLGMWCWSGAGCAIHFKVCVR
jgi:hypothetical protein